MGAITKLTANGGGDENEADFPAINSAIGMDWRAGALKVIVLTTDAPFHVGSVDGNDYGTIEGTAAALKVGVAPAATSRSCPVL